MSARIGMGSYVPGDSPLHRLDPRCKALVMLVLMVSSMLVGTPAQLALAAALTACLVLACGVRPGRVLSSVGGILVFLLVVGLFNLLFVQTGDVVATLGPVRLTTGGVWAAVLYSCRFGLLVVMGATLMVTTTPTALADAFESLLSPLSHLGLPVHEVAMVMSLALRFVPTLSDEAADIRQAQAARGGTLETGRPMERARAAMALMVPLLAGAIRHANGLSRALDARCYEGGAARTHYHELRLHPRDGAFAALAAGYLAILLFLG
ncbi:MAG: energy-coupling factor transporter transmembrane component T [Atopobiaceae bacterium]|jgi:energy-coupling factor transport system permease protein|nr:energy-coupling factor transporter transmembrane protein EcfT [Atopobiaceae bacterium]MCH4180314.1 energy-coupling factor transporter transmembrane protein EcfT [Atopobiaceae bacterium]MCH4214876.1 energy-coupling factor transporter transmembrane protein EcfT [Atopobiaceae bacterium]MCH4229313.1 energy-coupling factor transporter transmembrane protein EcfT [Atopobiaceae bacterium]MCH4276368.1 energy-coupling factor transporter transmembrane protein EcfT [Atopobiaceae bacterium]